MIFVPVIYAAEVDTAATALMRARKNGMSRRLMKDLVDDICNDCPIYK